MDYMVDPTTIPPSPYLKLALVGAVRKAIPAAAKRMGVPILLVQDWAVMATALCASSCHFCGRKMQFGPKPPESFEEWPLCGCLSKEAALLEFEKNSSVDALKQGVEAGVLRDSDTAHKVVCKCGKRFVLSVASVISAADNRKKAGKPYKLPGKCFACIKKAREKHAATP